MRIIPLILAGWLVTLPLTALALDGKALLQTVDRNLEPESYESYRKLINIEPDNTRKEFVIYSVKSGRDKIVTLFLSPASDKGRTTLRQGDNMWLYIPNVGKPIRITSLQSVTGGVFNNADIMRVDYAEEYNVTSINEKSDTYLLTLKAKSNSVAYDQLKMLVDKELLLPRQIEAYASSGMLIKTLHFKDLKAFGDGIKRPATIETDSPLYKGFRSVMIYSGLKKREVPAEVFTLGFMGRVEELRR
ncbi:MAG: outer membrane lipoprotein-sorting protein [Tolumonas sp.]|jgi:outer membrane lipoprotein-sorting protein|nr:MAG: outer membrane lipoprotein-sorting protein [Tolumonas sp.]